MTRTSSMGWRGRREWGRCGSSFLGPEHLPRAVSCVPAPKPSVLASSQGHLFRTRDEKQSPGRVYGYFPPICQSWFTISGDKVWWPPPSPAKWTPQRKFLSCTVVTYCISQAMGKLGTSLSSGHVMVNGTRTQVLLVGAPTQGRSPAMKLHFFMNSCVTPWPCHTEGKLWALEADGPEFEYLFFSLIATWVTLGEVAFKLPECKIQLTVSTFRDLLKITHESNLVCF